MPTTTVKTIGTTGDYSTISAWEAAAPADLVASDEIWQGQLQNQAFSSSTNLVTIAGSTSDATRYKELKCVSGASFRDNASVQSNALRWNSSNGASISCTGGNYTTAVIQSEQYSRLNGLQIQHTGTGNFSIPLDVTVANCVNENLIVETAGRSNGALRHNNVSALTMKNSLLVQRGSAKASIVEGTASQTTYYNVTLAVPSDKTAATNCFGANSFTTVALNACAVFGVSAMNASGTVTPTSCFSNLSGTGITTATYNTSQFVNITDSTRDFRLPSGSAMIDTYTADTTNSPVDIAGTTRPTGTADADAGCWEYFSGGGGSFSAAWARNANTILKVA